MGIQRILTLFLLSFSITNIIAFPVPIRTDSLDFSARHKPITPAPTPTLPLSLTEREIEVENTSRDRVGPKYPRSTIIPTTISSKITNSGPKTPRSENVNIKTETDSTQSSGPKYPRSEETVGRNITSQTARVQATGPKYPRGEGEIVEEGEEDVVVPTNAEGGPEFPRGEGEEGIVVPTDGESGPKFPRGEGEEVATKVEERDVIVPDGEISGPKYTSPAILR